ncbi:hypothetical protein ACNKHV_15520 [Shigella flexneri]
MSESKTGQLQTSRRQKDGIVLVIDRKRFAIPLSESFAHRDVNGSAHVQPVVYPHYHR